MLLSVLVVNGGQGGDDNIHIGTATVTTHPESLLPSLLSVTRAVVLGLFDVPTGRCFCAAMSTMVWWSLERPLGAAINTHRQSPC